MNSDRSQLPPAPHDNLQIAMETTGTGGSLAVLQGESVLQHRKLDSRRRTAALLAPALADLLRWCRESQKQPQLVSIAAGPGSFTGLRIGVTTAKTLAYACDLTVIAVDSLASIAAVALQQQPEIENILVAINAYRGQVFTAKYQRDSLLVSLSELTDRDRNDDLPQGEADWWSRLAEQVQVVDADQWRQILETTPAGDPVTGDRRVFEQRADLRFIDRELPDAVGVGLLATRASILGIRSDPLQLTPRYLRPSAAEEKAARDS